MTKPGAVEFSADMTQLIAADSYLIRPQGTSQVFPPSSPLHGIRHKADPLARCSFRRLSNVFTNGLPIHLAKPPNMPDQLSAIMMAWSKESSGQQPKKPERLEPAALCQLMAPHFCQFAEYPTIADKMIGFSDFQFSHPNLMDTFWRQLQRRTGAPSRRGRSA